MISKALIAYITEECNQVLPQGAAMADLKIIAMNSAGAETVKAGAQEATGFEYGSFTDYTTQLLKLILVAAIYSPRSRMYIGRMPTFSTSTQASLKDLIEELIGGDQPKGRSDADQRRLQEIKKSTFKDNQHQQVTEPSLLPAKDLEMLFEERFGVVMAEIENHVAEKKDLQNDLRDKHNRLMRLQEHNVGPKGAMARKMLMICYRIFFKND